MNSAVLEKVPGVQALSRDEKWELVGLLWEELGYRDDERDVAIREVLSERAAGYRANPTDVFHLGRSAASLPREESAVIEVLWLRGAEDDLQLGSTATKTLGKGWDVVSTMSLVMESPRSGRSRNPVRSSALRFGAFFRDFVTESSTRWRDREF